MVIDNERGLPVAAELTTHASMERKIGYPYHPTPRRPAIELRDVGSLIEVHVLSLAY
jgi:hypothetical protein